MSSIQLPKSILRYVPLFLELIMYLVFGFPFLPFHEPLGFDLSFLWFYPYSLQAIDTCFFFYSACPTAFNFAFSSHCYSPQSPSSWSYPQSYQTVLGHTTPLKACECNNANVLFPPTLFFSPLVLISAVLAFSGRGIGLVGG